MSKLQKPTQVCVIYDSQFVSGGEVCEGEEDYKYASREDSEYDFELKGVFAGKIPSNMGSYSHTVLPFDTQNKVCYVVVVRYRDGNTFGKSNGLACIEGVCATKDEARNIAESIKNKTFVSPHGYNEWEGYFARLQSVQIEVAEIEF